jgi:hypothetical protein
MGSPYDKPQTAIGAIYQMHLGQMGYHTGNTANHAGLEQRRLQQERERKERSRKPWWSSSSDD